MKIALFNHPFSDFYTSYNRLYSQVTSYLADMIHGHSKRCFNVVGGMKKEIDLPDELVYLQPYLKPDDTGYSFFSGYYRFGNVSNFNHKEFFAFEADCVIITSFAYCYFEGVREMIAYIKSLRSVPVIIGGPGPSSRPDYYLTHTEADYVCVGPAELSLQSLVDKMEDSAGEVHLENVFSPGKNPGIDLDREYSFEPFVAVRKKRAHLQLTRGCYKKCTYCSVAIVSGKKYRCSSLTAVEEAVKKLADRCLLQEQVIKHFDFEDDSISFNSGYMLAVIDIVKKYFPRVTFSCENGIDFTTLDAELADRLDKAGFSQWNLSLTSVNNALLQEKKRGYTGEKFDRIIGLLCTYKKPLIVYYIAGLPGDSWHAVFETLVYLASKPVLIGISPFYPVPSTKDAARVSAPLAPVLTKGTSFFPWAHLTTSKLVTFFILTRFINALKNLDISYKHYFNASSSLPEDATPAGIVYSIKNRAVYYSRCGKFSRHNLDPEIEERFFAWLEGGGKIAAANGDILDGSFFQLC